MRIGRYRSSSSNNRKFSNSKSHLNLAMMTKNLAFKGHLGVLIGKEGKGHILAREKDGKEDAKSGVSSRGARVRTQWVG